MHTSSNGMPSHGNSEIVFAFFKMLFFFLISTLGIYSVLWNGHCNIFSTDQKNALMTALKRYSEFEYIELKNVKWNRNSSND